MHKNLKNVVFLDFETRSMVDITSTGAWKYAESETTDILCMVWAVEDQKPKLFIPPQFNDSFELETVSGREMIDEFQKLIANEEILFVAHNAFFEKAIWHNILHSRYGMPAIPDDRWRCSAAVAASFALPRALGNVCPVLGLQHQKDDEGHRIMLQLSKPKLDKRAGKHVFNEHDKYAHKFESLYAYCVKDVEAERDLWMTLRPLAGEELNVWLLDQKINRRGLFIDKEFCEAAAELAELDDEHLNDRLYTLTGGEVQRATNVAQLLDWINRRINGTIDNVTKATIAGLLKEVDERVHTDKEVVREVLSIRQSVGKTSVAKFAAMLNSLCADGRLRDLLMYHGASTGRWTGKLVQLQNLPRGIFKSAEEQETAIEIVKRKDLKTLREKYGNVKEVLSSCIRGLIIPSKGHALYVADYASIEARVLFWIAGHQEGIAMYERGIDLYKHMAMKIYNLKTEAEVTSAQRQLGKQAILGCGYGMGAKKFRETCLGYGMDVSEELAEETKNAYRELHHPIPQLWRDVEAAAIEAVRTRQPVVCGKITFAVVGKFLHCKLPSGRLLSYFKPTLKPDTTPWGTPTWKLEFLGENSVTRKFMREATYGGRLVENIVQAVARDLMAHAMQVCENAGFKILVTVHDELIAEREGHPDFPIIRNAKTEAEKIKATTEWFVELMSALPTWADGCPVTAEGWSGFRYKK